MIPTGKMYEKFRKQYYNRTSWIRKVWEQNQSRVSFKNKNTASAKNHWFIFKKECKNLVRFRNCFRKKHSIVDVQLGSKYSSGHRAINCDAKRRSSVCYISVEQQPPFLESPLNQPVMTTKEHDEIYPAVVISKEKTKCRALLDF